MQVWELFPSFCTRPVKFVESFKVFAPVLGAALRDNRYPALQANVCRGLCVLLASSTNEAEVKDSSEDQQPESKPAAKLGAPPDLLPEERAANLEALAAVSQNFLPILFAQYQQAVMRGAAGQEMAQTALAENLLQPGWLGELFADVPVEAQLAGKLRDEAPMTDTPYDPEKDKPIVGTRPAPAPDAVPAE